MDLASARIDREEAETPLGPVRNRAIAEALAVDAWMRGWRQQHEPEHAPEDSLYGWGPAWPDDFVTNFEQPAAMSPA